MNIIIKRFFAFILSCAIVFGSVQSSFAAVSGGWTATAADATIAGATATIKAFRGRGASAMQSVITHKPTAVAVGKEIVKGGGLLAVAFAMSKLLDAGVDWVLDPENNRIKYTVAGVPEWNDPSSRYYWTGTYGHRASTAAAVGELTGMESCKRNKWTGCSVSTVMTSDSTAVWTLKYKGGSISNPISRTENPAYVAGSASPADEEKYIPISTVAAEVLKGAEAGHAPSQDFVKAVAVGVANSGALDTELEAAATPTSDTPTADPVEPAKPFDDSSILAALKSILSALGLLSLLSTISDSLTGFFEWFRAEPEPIDEDTTIAIPDNDVLPADTDINFGGSCPANFEVNSSIFGNPINIVLLDTAKFCGFLSTFVKYPVYAVSSLFALYILGGRKDV